MTSEPDATRHLSIPVTVEAPPTLAARSHRAGVLATVEQRFRARLQRLGVPGAPSLELRPGASSRAVRVRVHQRPQPFSPELMRRVWVAVAPADRADVPQRQAGLAPTGFPDGWFTSFVDGLGADGGDGDWELALRFIGELAMEAAFEHPACLLGADQVASLAGGAQGEDGPPPDHLRQALEELVEAGAMPGAEAVAEALAEGARRHAPLRDTIESLAAAGRADRLEIQLPDGDADALLPRGVGDRSFFLYAHLIPDEAAAFEQMERELFAASGLRLPPLFVRRVDDLPAGMLRLTVNNLVTAPAPCPPPLTESVKRELRRHAGRLLTIEDVEYMLARLDGIFPELISATLERVPLGELTRVLRALLEEGVWIRDLRAILERLLQYDTVPVDASRYRLLDDRLPVPIGSSPGPAPPWSWYLAFVRSGRSLQNHLSHAYRQGGAVARQVRAIELPEQVEGSVREAAAGVGRRDGGTWEQAQSAVLAAVWAELSRLPATKAPVVLLVRDPLLRRLVRDHLAVELPDLPVLVRAELRPDIRVLPADAAHQSDADTPAPPPRPVERRQRPHGRFFPPNLNRRNG